MSDSNHRMNQIRRTLSEMMNAPGFAEDIDRQPVLLRGAPDEEEALDFIEAIISNWGDDLG